MLRVREVLLAGAALAVLTTPAASIDICVDPGAPIVASTGQIALNATAVKETGAKYARVNFILGPWTSPNDTVRRGPGNLTWKETYDQIINSLTAQGIQVYALIGAEAVKSSHPVNSNQYVEDYANNFRTIVGWYRDKVRVYESFNEPNDWAGGTTAQVQPAFFARMLKRIYEELKINHGHADDPSWQVKLVSGPLFSHDLDTGASYMNQVYLAGIAQHGWNTFKNTHGTFPLDDFGYHIYVAQGPSSQTHVTNKINQNLNAFWNVIKTYEGANTTKKLWLSEVGWNTSQVSETEQARNLTLSFNLFKNDARVQMANWFCLVDFGSNAFYGLLRGMPPSDANKKPSWYAFREFALTQTPQATINGVVRDNFGFAVPEVLVRILPNGPEVHANQYGEYSIGNLLPGTYTLEGSSFGYRNQNRITQLGIGSTATVNFTLLKAAFLGAPSEAKLLPDTSFVRLDDVIVSAQFPQDRIYVQNFDRSSGIGLLGVSHPVGTVIRATGFVVEVDGERVLTQVTTEALDSGTSPTPVHLTNRMVSGGEYGRQQAVVDDAALTPPKSAVGLNNVGLLVRTSGIVSAVYPNDRIVYIDDGSRLVDGSGKTGLRIAWPDGEIPGIDTFLQITGIAGVTRINNRTVRLLKPRYPSDIVHL